MSRSCLTSPTSSACSERGPLHSRSCGSEYSRMLRRRRSMAARSSSASAPSMGSLGCKWDKGGTWWLVLRHLEVEGEGKKASSRSSRVQRVLYLIMLGDDGFERRQRKGRADCGLPKRRHLSVLLTRGRLRSLLGCRWAVTGRVRMILDDRTQRSSLLLARIPWRRSPSEYKR